MNVINEEIAKRILINIVKSMGFDSVIRYHNELYAKKSHHRKYLKCLINCIEDGCLTLNNGNYSCLIQACLGKTICIFNPVKCQYVYAKFPDTIEELMIENDLMSND